MGDPLVDNADKISYASGQNIENVIAAETVVMSTSNSTGAKGVIGSWLSPINQYAYPVGIYTYNAGQSFLELWGKRATSSSLTHAPDVPPVRLSVQVTSSGLVKFSATVNATVGVGGTIPITAYVALLELDNPGSLDTPPDGNLQLHASSGGPLATDQSARIIGYKNSQPATGGAGSLTTFPHGLNHVPLVYLWDDSGDYSPSGYIQVDPSLPVAVITAKMDATNIYIGSNSAYPDTYFRGY